MAGTLVEPELGFGLGVGPLVTAEIVCGEVGGRGKARPAGIELPGFYGLPQLLIYDAQFGDVRNDPALLRVSAYHHLLEAQPLLREGTADAEKLFFADRPKLSNKSDSILFWQGRCFGKKRF